MDAYFKHILMMETPCIGDVRKLDLKLRPTCLQSSRSDGMPQLLREIALASRAGQGQRGPEA